MTALVVVDINPKNADKLGAYSALAINTLVPFGGKLLAKGPIKALFGEAVYMAKMVIQFPDRSNAESWYQSDAYQQLIPTRDQGMDSRFHLIG